MPYPRNTTSLPIYEDVIASNSDEVLSAAHVRVLSVLATAEVFNDGRHLKYERRGCNGIEPEVEPHKVAGTHCRGHTWWRGQEAKDVVFRGLVWSGLVWSDQI